MLALNDVMGFDSIGLFANKLTIPKFQPLARDPGKKRVAWATLCYSPLSARSGISLFSRCEAALRVFRPQLSAKTLLVSAVVLSATFRTGP